MTGRLSLCSVIVCFTVFISPSMAQPTRDAAVTRSDSSATGSVRTVPKLRWYTPIANIPLDWARWWEVSMRPEMIPHWGAVTGLTGALLLTDDATYTPSARLYTSSPAAKKWSDFFAEFGDGTSQFALAGSLGAYGILFGDDKALRTGTEIVEVVIASGAVVQVLKHLTGRESPYVRSSPTGVWKPFPGQIDYHRYVPHHDAFPSGHICTSLATVIVVAENYPDVHWIRPLGYTLTTLVGIGMGTNGIHWYSDYPLGLFLGYTFGMIASHPEGLPEEFFSPLPNTHLSVLPVMQQNGAGIDVTLTF